MFFIVVDERDVDGRGNIFGDIIYSQIIVNGEVIELIAGFPDVGRDIFFDDPVGYDPDTGRRLTGISSSDINIIRGLCRFSPDKLVVYDIINHRGLLDDSTKEIIFIREDIEY